MLYIFCIVLVFHVLCKFQKSFYDANHKDINKIFGSAHEISLIMAYAQMPIINAHFLWIPMNYVSLTTCV